MKHIYVFRMTNQIVKNSLGVSTSIHFKKINLVGDGWATMKLKMMNKWPSVSDNFLISNVYRIHLWRQYLSLLFNECLLNYFDRVCTYSGLRHIFLSWLEMYSSLPDSANHVLEQTTSLLKSSLLRSKEVLFKK